MEAKHERLRWLIASASNELRREGGECGTLLGQLEVLQHSLATNEPSVELLRSTLRAFPAKRIRTRGADPAGPGLRETLRLWQELNRMVDARQGPKAKEKPTPRPMQAR
jgi:hypothetical protein